MDKKYDVFSCRTIDGDVIREFFDWGYAIEFGKDHDEVAYVEAEKLDDNGTCYHSRKIWTRNFFEVLKQKYDITDFTGYIGEFFDDSYTEKERIAAIEPFLFEIYSIATELLEIELEVED